MRGCVALASGRFCCERGGAVYTCGTGNCVVEGKR